MATNDTHQELLPSNNTIQLTVDGTQSGSITVPNAEYSSEDALATAIQTAINADTNLVAQGKTVTVTHQMEVIQLHHHQLVLLHQ